MYYNIKIQALQDNESKNNILNIILYVKSEKYDVYTIFYIYIYEKKMVE